MRFFTPEEKELIVNTPINLDAFDLEGMKTVVLYGKPQENDVFGFHCLTDIWCILFEKLEFVRQKYLRTKDERYFTELVRLLPASYKVVKL